MLCRVYPEDQTDVLCDSSFIPKRVKDSSLLRYADSSLCWMKRRRRGLTRSSIQDCQPHLAPSMKPSLFDTVHLLHAQSTLLRVSAGGISAYGQSIFPREVLVHFKFRSGHKS